MSLFYTQKRRIATAKLKSISQYLANSQPNRMIDNIDKPSLTGQIYINCRQLGAYESQGKIVILNRRRSDAHLPLS